MRVAERLGVRPRAGRPLDATVDERILRAAREVVGEVGLARTTWARVSARSGSGYPTMLRRWSTVRDLVLDALHDLAGEAPIDGDAPTSRALADALREDLGALAAGRSRMFVRTMVFAAADDPELAKDVDEVLIAPRRRRYAALLELGADRGDVRADADLDAATQSLCGALMGAIVARVAADPRSADGIVALLLEGSLTPDA